MVNATQTELFRIYTDWGKWLIIIEAHVYLILAILAIIVGSILLWLIVFKKHISIREMTIEISGQPKATFKVQRNEDNLYVANRIYVELTTRKAAIPFDEDCDVISEVYDSLYALFGIIRDEIKAVPGQYLRDHDPTTALIGLTTQILNEGLRPHLTTYHAKFRKWYNAEQEKGESSNLSPQQIQKKYPEYKELVNSLKHVNVLLAKYAEDLHKLIKK